MDFTPTPSSGGAHTSDRVFLNTGVKTRGGARQLLSFSSRGQQLPSIRRELLALSHHGDVSELRLSYWMDNLFDLCSALTLCRISEGLYAALRQVGSDGGHTTGTSLALTLDWVFWFATAFTTCNHMNAFTNRFDADTLPGESVLCPSVCLLSVRPSSPLLSSPLLSSPLLSSAAGCRACSLARTRSIAQASG